MNLFGLLPLLILFANLAATYADLDLQILHNNDMHARFEAVSQRSGLCKDKKRCYGGFARVAHVVRSARERAAATNATVLFLNAGDTYTGSPWFTVHKWEIVATFLNLLGPDVACLGNHEFDEGVAGLVPYVNASKFPIVAANLDFAEESQLGRVVKSHVLKVAEEKIGVIGYLTRDTVLFSDTGKVKFEDEVIALRAESEKLDREGVKIIIGLGHSGYEIDQRIAREVPLVDVVVGGHTNTFLWNGPQPDLEKVEGPYPTVVTQSSGKKVPVVQAYAHTKYMGRLNLTFDDQGHLVRFGGSPLLLDHSIPEDADVLQLLETYRGGITKLNEEVVGSSRVFLDGNEKTCRHVECNFGNLIADAWVAYHAHFYRGAYWTDVPIGIINGGAIRGSVEPKVADGTIGRGELLGAMPYSDQLYALSLNGSDLLATLEIGLRSDGETSFGEFLQVSGLRYTFDRSRPVGSRVTEAYARCGFCIVPKYEKVVPHKTYRIIMAAFLFDGGDGHDAIKNGAFDVVSEDITDLEAVVWYLKRHSPVYPEENHRIVELKKEAV